MQRIAIVTNEIPEYRYPVFKRLIESPGIDCRILVTSPIERSCVLARQNLPLKYSTSVSFWRKTRHRDSGTTQREQVPIPVALIADLLSFRPNTIIAGDFGARSLVCWLTAKLLQADFIICSEEILASARGRSWLQQRIRRFLAYR